MKRKYRSIIILLFFLLFSCSVSLTESGDGLFPYKVFHKYGYINKKGEIIIQPLFKQADRFIGGIARIRQGKYYGAIDTKGNIVIPLEYEDLDSFNGYELAPARKTGKMGFIDKKGNTVLPFIYDAADSFSEGMAAVEIDNNYYFIDTTGKKLFSFQADGAYKFHDGCAVIYIHDDRPAPNRDYTYIDRNGKLLTSSFFSEFTEQAEDFSDGYALVEISLEEKKFIDKNGKIAFSQLNIAPLSSFSAGLAAVDFTR
jgi:hypothetical protein